MRRIIFLILLLNLVALPIGSISSFADDLGTWRGKWWNYYERALSRSEAGEWDSAVKDLLKACDLREKDQRRARTYGMHFVDYFPHRELGILYFNKGEVEKATAELELSIRSESSAKAFSYLNRARQKLLRSRTAHNVPPPILEIASPSSGYLTAKETIRVSGLTNSMGYISHLSINGVPYRIDLARQEISFNQPVKLNEGLNNVKIIAEDLLGRRTEKILPVVLKREGPAIAISELSMIEQDGKRYLKMNGEVLDRAGLATISVEGKLQQLVNTKSYKLDWNLPVIGKCPSFVAIEATDVVGNRTFANVPVQAIVSNENIISYSAHEEEYLKSGRTKIVQEKADQLQITRLLAIMGRHDAPSRMQRNNDNHSTGMRRGLPPHGNRRGIAPLDSLPGKTVPERSTNEVTAFDRLAFENNGATRGYWSYAERSAVNSSATLGSDSNSAPSRMPDREFPIIAIDDSEETRSVFGIETFALQGYVSDNKQVKNVRVAGIDLVIPVGKKVYLSKTVKLIEGENKIRIEATNEAGNVAVKEITVIRVVPSVMQPTSRTSMLITPPDFDGREAGVITPIFDESLSGVFVKQKRFRLVERKKIKQILDEQKISVALNDPDQAIKIGNLAAADIIVAGTVREDSKSVEVFLRVINSETAEQITQVDGYIEDKGRESIKQLIESIASKVAENFPIVEGMVIKRDGQEVLVDVGSQAKLKQNMGVVFFRKGSDIRHPVSGKIIGTDTVQLGEGKIVEVQDNFSKIVLSEKAASTDLTEKDLLVTK